MRQIADTNNRSRLITFIIHQNSYAAKRSDHAEPWRNIKKGKNKKKNQLIETDWTDKKDLID